MTETTHNIYLTDEELRFIHEIILEKIAAVKAGETVIYHHGSKERGDELLSHINNKLERT